jgi:hypothetical protein
MTQTKLRDDQMEFSTTDGHDHDGTDSKQIAYSNITGTPLKSTGAEINTGTEDAKIVTPKAIADSKLADYIRGDGWISANETWAYASASTITVPSGAAAKYAVGDRIKWTQTGVRYGVIVGVADTVLTIAVNTDYVVADAAISLNYYSHQASPVGYPQWFNYVPILSQGASTDIAKTVTFAKYNLVGRVVTTKVVLMATGTGTAGSNILITLPIAGVRGRDYGIIGTGLYDDISSNTYCCVASYTNKNTEVMLIATSNTTRGAGVGSNPSLAVDSDDRFELVASYQM